jgi:hypothetical protein
MNLWHLICPGIAKKVPIYSIVQKLEQIVGDETYYGDFPLLTLT